MRNVVEKINTHILCSITFFPKNHAVCDIIWECVVEADRPQMTVEPRACVLHAA